jgi:hypothetical protein
VFSNSNSSGSLALAAPIEDWGSLLPRTPRSAGDRWPTTDLLLHRWPTIRDTDLPLFSLILRLALLMDLPKAAVLVPSSIDPTPHDCMLGGQAGRQQARTMCHRTLRWLGSTRIIDYLPERGTRAKEFSAR